MPEFITGTILATLFLALQPLQEALCEQTPCLSGSVRSLCIAERLTSRILQ